MSIQTGSTLASGTLPASPQRRIPIPLLAAVVGLPLLGLRQIGKRSPMRRGSMLVLAVLTLLPMLGLGGCGGGYFGPTPQTYTVSVTGTSGSLQQSTTVSLTVQ